METLKYFSPHNLADFHQDNPRKYARAVKRQFQLERAYYRELDRLKGRISKRAWSFFRNGFGRYGPHDAQLLRLTVGDGIDFRPDGKTPFYLNQNSAAVRLEFMSQTQDFLLVFDCRGAIRVWCDLTADLTLYSKAFSNLGTCEIIAKGTDRLRLGFIFESQSTILIEFRKLGFRRRRLKRKYDLGEMYY